MGLFNKKEKKIISEISKKNKTHHEDIARETKELLEDLRHEYQENKIILEDFSAFIHQIQSSLSEKETEQLNTYFRQVSKMKSCARKSIEGLNYLSREQKKIAQEALRDCEQFLS